MAMVTAMASSGLLASSPLLKASLRFGIKGLSSSPRYIPRRIRALNSVAEKIEASQDAITLGSSALAGAVFAAMASSESALAAQQVMELAAGTGDNRGAAILLPLVPAIGWVLFNILQPALNQINKMRSAKGLVVGLGLGTLVSIAASSQASAETQEIVALAAENDSRGLLLLGVLFPAIGWVLYNILRPALNQLDKMRASKAIIAGGLGFGALTSMLFSPNAEAADEIAALAASADNDNRGLLLLIVILPAIGWVLFNILRPALNQIDKMRSK